MTLGKACVQQWPLYYMMLELEAQYSHDGMTCPQSWRVSEVSEFSASTRTTP